MKLKEAFDSRHRGAMIKADHFFDIYDSHLYHLKDQKLKILEIGVYNGGSLYMWRKYFPNSEVVGIDIDPYTKRWEEKDKDIRVYIGDQCDLKFLQEIVDKEGPFDLIIDDAGHENHQIITSLDFLFKHLNEGGTYVVEDTFAAYWPDYSCKREIGTQGEKLNPLLKEFDERKTSMEHLKKLTDSLNCWAYRHKYADYLKKEGELDQYEKELHSIHFYDSIVFLNKFKRPGEKSFGKDVWYEHIDKNAEYSTDENGVNKYGYKQK
jgi:cephalosporin hydroxylase